jgi:hypothetical protein
MKVINLKILEKMRKINLYKLIRIIPLFFLLACDETPPILFKDAVIIFEGAEELEIAESLNGGNEAPNKTTLTISRANSDVSQAVTINYSVEAKFVEGGASANGTFSFSGTAGQITIPANQYTGTVELSTINNTNADGDKEVTITLTGGAANGVSLGYPGSAGVKKSVKVIIKDDDCALDLDEFTGAFIVKVEADEVEYECTLERGAGNTLIAKNPIIYDPLVNIGSTLQSLAAGTTIEIDPATLTTNIPSQFYYTNSSGAARNLATAPLDKGSVSTCSKSFSVNFRVTRASDGSTVFDVTNCVFTKKQ